MTIAVNLGYPRIGARRELKKALEEYWGGKRDERALREACRKIRREFWLAQLEAGIQHIPSNDFSLYDHVLDTAAMVGLVPSRYGWSGDTVDLETYFMMARGLQTDSRDVRAMEMTKWFDTNYHYIVPEFEPDSSFRLSSMKPVEEFLEAKELGVHTRPVLLGPVSFLLLGKAKTEGLEPLSLLAYLLPVYALLLRKLAEAGADWIQIDEPCLVLDLPDRALAAYGTAYARLGSALTHSRVCLATYFEDLRHNLDTVLALPVDALHIDLVRAPAQLDRVLKALPERMSLSLGLVDGRNVWRTDLAGARRLLIKAVNSVGTDRVMVGPSCSLMFSPVDLERETALDSNLRSWMAFARQKLGEIAALNRSINEGMDAVQEEFGENQVALERRRKSTKIHIPEVKERVASITLGMMRRPTTHVTRKVIQEDRLMLPLLPTTTIGSFPQTKEVRAARRKLRRGEMTDWEYDVFIRREIKRTVRFQEEIGLDVLVHGEFERTDMVEYFGEQLEGVALTKGGWVQSYGSRCVRPPIIYGDVRRPRTMTVEWLKYAQSLTSKPVKGMLTGPVTILQWSFVRDDQPLSETCRQIALAIRDEVRDLEEAGLKIIQIDEAAFREGLPLRLDDRFDYLKWAVECFRLASSGVSDGTQIHTHMCYCEFNDVYESIAAMDADVISIESSRSQMELLGAFSDYHYPYDIGPGVYDIHSTRVPCREEVERLLRKALEVFSPGQLWVNPDCGLKTRRWEEVRQALREMVAAARTVREEVDASWKKHS